MDAKKPWVAEYAKSSRAKCAACSENILKDSFRLGRNVEAQHYEGWMQRWHHFSCIIRKRIAVDSIDDVEGFDSLRWEDQKKLEKYIDGGAGEDEESGAASKTSAGAASKTSTSTHSIEIAKSSRASCRVCKEKLAKGDVRIASVTNGKHDTSYRHVNCFLELGSWKQPIEEIQGWDDIGSEEQKAVQELAKPIVGALGKRPAEEDKQDTKKQKVADVHENANKDLEKKLEKQANALWSLQDELKKNVSKAELKEMIEMNGGLSSGSENDLWERCADGMMFGPLKCCLQCKGSIVYEKGQYSCKGYISEWSKCNYTTREPEREPIWEIPLTDNKYLEKWYKRQRKEKESRILRPQLCKSETSSFLKGLHVLFMGETQVKPQAEWKQLIEEAGGTVHDSMRSDISLIVSTESELNIDENLRTSMIPVVGERYLVDCTEKKIRLPYKEYKLERSKPPAVSKVKVKGRSAVHEESELQDKGHILEVGHAIYNVTLNLVDLTHGRNSYYILQIIEEDNRNVCHVFRKWGKTGDSMRGGTKIQKMDRESAIHEFKRLYLEKTGNSWESWVNKGSFEKKKGKFYPVEIDYGLDEAPQRELGLAAGSRSALDSRVVNLLKMLFDMETYRSAMTEFEINTNEMPLGKLTKRHIAKGFEVLTEVQNILGLPEGERQVPLLDASNRFYTLIPAVHPALIGDQEALQTKIQMLEALRDIEIASQLINSGEEDGETDPLDFHYKKLHCDVLPLPHNSSEFNLVKNYLERTHAPTHRDWALTLEDVFVVRREGESESYTPMKSSLKNNMLLWHGSRTTNFVGILSQGLRIAPPEAPVTGYMFGKGVYFADLVSKSAQYCFTSRSNPVGLMLLSEVALGNIKEYTHAQYMEKPPAGYNATKGIGSTTPEPSEFQVLDEDIVVPCGRPVPSKIRSDLLYNEYIVYNTSQIKLRYLLKVRFQHKY